MKVIFFGTPPFAAQVLEELFRQKISVVAVVSKPDRCKGRSGTPVPTAVKTVALAHHPQIPIYQPEIVSSLEFAPILQQHQADLFIVVAYGEILKSHLLKMPHRACLNLHASLLPKYRGAAPIQRCLIEGATETGVTIIHMVQKMDAGDMIEKVHVPIGPDLTFGELEQFLCEVGKHALVRVIKDYEHNSPPQIAQDLTQVTFAPKLELEDCEINWQRPAQDIHNLVRGVNPHPGAWCYISIKGEKKRLKVHRTQVVMIKTAQPGLVLNRDHLKENIIMSTGEHALELLEIQLEGKKIVTSAEFKRGLPDTQISFI